MASELERRLDRIYAAIDMSIETDVSTFEPTVTREGNRVIIEQTFMGGRTEPEIENLAHSVIQNIASFPDHLRRWCKQNGEATTAIDQSLDASIDVRVIIDLNNNDKHGWPPRDGGKSGLSPRLPDGIESVMEMSAPAGGGFVGYVGFKPVGSPGAHHRVIITGNVSDANGNPIGMLHEIEQRAVEACEGMLAKVRPSSVQ